MDGYLGGSMEGFAGRLEVIEGRTGVFATPRSGTTRVILDGHPMNAIEDLMPGTFRKTSTRAA
jgi:hypothetical protein